MPSFKLPELNLLKFNLSGFGFPAFYQRNKQALLGGGAVAGAAAVGITASLLINPPAPNPALKLTGPKELTPAQVKLLEHQAFADAEARAGQTRPISTTLTVRSGETLQGAIQRAGVAANEAKQAVDMLSKAIDTIHIKAGLVLQAAITKPRPGRPGAVQLVGLALKSGPASTVTLSRTFDGALRLRQLEEKVRAETTVAQGDIHGSLYVAALNAGADSRLVSEAVKLFSHKLDFSRDIHPDDQFKLVFDRKVTESGRTIETGSLQYAELAAKGQVTRFYRFSHDGRDQYFDEFGKNIKGFLLRTPVDAARVTSGFGMRFHPVLGYTRMHQGIDFGAPTGTPVYAAGDGVVAEARWANGYGHWLKIKHSGGWATGYGHLSAYARGLRVGQHVAQGQVVAYVGMTGIATGPHLHYEVMQGPKKMDPKGAKVPQGTVLGGRELARFKSEKARIDAMIRKSAPAQTQAQTQAQTASLRAPTVAGGGN
jgi:murein DD-endopeptidase MepM/ murein hydrolase activator NlpD